MIVFETLECSQFRGAIATEVGYTKLHICVKRLEAQNLGAKIWFLLKDVASLSSCLHHFLREICCIPYLHFST